MFKNERVKNLKRQTHLQLHAQNEALHVAYLMLYDTS